MSDDAHPVSACHQCGRAGLGTGFCSLACRTAALPARRELLHQVRDHLVEGAGGAAGASDAETALVQLTRAEVDFAVGLLDGEAGAGRSLRMPDGLPPLDGLTTAQWTVLLLVGDGFTNREIARMLSVSSHTVRNYLSAVLARTRLRNRTEVGALVAGIRTMVELAPATVPCLEPLLDLPSHRPTSDAHHGDDPRGHVVRTVGRRSTAPPLGSPS